jgi:hypothetical protein
MNKKSILNVFFNKEKGLINKLLINNLNFEIMKKLLLSLVIMVAFATISFHSASGSYYADWMRAWAYNDGIITYLEYGHGFTNIDYISIDMSGSCYACYSVAWYQGSLYGTDYKNSPYMAGYNLTIYASGGQISAYYN